MFGPEGERGTEFNRIAREAKERQGEPLDYHSILLWKLASALAAGNGSNTRTHEIEDLIVLLTPYMDTRWHQDDERISSWIKRNYRGAVDNGKVHNFQLAAIVNLMKRVGLTPAGVLR